MKRAYVLVGVSRTGRLRPLPAVAEGLAAMRRWIRDQGVPDELVTCLDDSDGGVVDAAAVFAAVKAFADSRTVEQLTLYFCGHGVVNDGSELWLLSGAPDDPSEAVNVAKSVRLAERGSIPHVVLLSDACRSPAASLQFGEVTGSSVFPNPPTPGSRKVDVFYATRVGENAHQVSEEEADAAVAEAAKAFHAVWSEVVAEALSGAHPQLLEPLGATESEFDVVRPWSLHHALPELLSSRLSELGVATRVVQSPESRITSDPKAVWLSQVPRGQGGHPGGGGGEPPGDDVAGLPADDVGAPPGDGDIPPPPPRRPRGRRPRPGSGGHVPSTPVPTPPPVAIADPTEDQARAAAAQLVAAAAQIGDADVTGVRLSADAPPERTDMAVVRRTRSAMVVTTGDLALLLPVVGDHRCTVTLDKDVVVDVRWHSPSTSVPGSGQQAAHDLEWRSAVASRTRFGLHWLTDPDDAIDRALAVADEDPSVPVYVAYGLVQEGYRSRVPELLERLRAQSSPVPYDVALLAEDPSDHDGPAVPTLAEGWSLLGADGIAPTPSLPSRHPSLWTVFRTGSPEALDSLLTHLTPDPQEQTMRTLVLVHGRSQQGKDSKALKQEWLDALHRGLRAAGSDVTVPDDKVRFPYYGDTLDDLVTDVEGKAAAVVVQSAGEPNAAEQEFIAAVVSETVESVGLSEQDIRAHAVDGAVVEQGVQNWPWVLAALRALENVRGLGSVSLALATRDVYTYLRNPGIQTMIEAGVRQAFDRESECVVVGHSLGSVVAYDVLKRRAASEGWTVPTFITLGSPLAVRTIVEALAPIATPDGVQQWFNAYDSRDVVSLHPLDASHFPVTPDIENLEVTNDTPNRHGISGYLSDPDVARRILTALTD
ncbi:MULTISPECIES: hypothetical protein [unclassified Knoellia]|uniref:hypothetical protein n=1 Tax=Knoellia altitudinis TaxID=3404795 RepID=UPI00360EE3F0